MAAAAAGAAASAAVSLELRKPRMLMLHGWCQNGEALRGKLHAFVRKLKDVCECVFMDAPHTVPPDVALGERDNARAWWYYDAEDRANIHDFTAKKVYHGWPESRRAIAEMAAKNGPFDAICGFSQGAVAVHVLMCEIEAVNRLGMVAALPEECRHLAASPPKCVILAAGFPAACDLPFTPAEHLLRTPSLHISSAEDTRVPAEFQAALGSRFADPKFLYHDKGHSIAQRAGDMATIADFLRCHLSASAPTTI